MSKNVRNGSRTDFDGKDTMVGMLYGYFYLITKYKARINPIYQQVRPSKFVQARGASISVTM